MYDSIISIIKQGPEPEHTICYDIPTHNFLNSELFPALKLHCDTEAKLYCEKRDQSENSKKFALVKETVEAELKSLFNLTRDLTEGECNEPMFTCKIQLMSSYGANMHLDNVKSDIDFGILIGNMTKDKVEIYGQILINNGYQFHKMIYNYYVYTKQINGIDIEVKVRDLEKSIEVVRLHNHLDSLPVETQQLLTWAKYIVQNDELLYNKLKKIIYSAYHTEIKLS